MSRKIEDLRPHLQWAFSELKKRYEEKFPDRELKLICAYRSPEEQYALWLQGRKPDGTVTDKSKIVTNIDGKTKKSMHNFYPSNAFDVGVFIKSVYLTGAEYYTPIGTMLDGLFVEWGGNWESLKDYPHIQGTKEK